MICPLKEKADIWFLEKKKKKKKKKDELLHRFSASFKSTPHYRRRQKLFQIYHRRICKRAKIFFAQSAFET